MAHGMTTLAVRDVSAILLLNCKRIAISLKEAKVKTVEPLCLNLDCFLLVF